MNVLRAAPLLALGLWMPAQAAARTSCITGAQAFAGRCAAEQGLPVVPLYCGEGLATFRVDETWDVEIAAGRTDALRTLAHVGVSPLGEGVESEAFDRFVRCVEPNQTALLRDVLRADVRRARSRYAALFRNILNSGFTALSEFTAPRLSLPFPVPWRMVAALACALMVAWPMSRRLRRPGPRVTAMGLLALGAATFVFRRAAFAEAFFHQNGHGAMWIGCALGGPCTYGEGFRDLFGFAAAFAPAQAERGVFVANGVLAAVAVMAAWVLARAAGAPRTVAWALALVMAVDPGLGRLAQSESYFGVIAWLLLMAAALLATGARAGRVRTLAFVASVLGAGLIVSQSALVHPLAWVPAALVPLAAWAGPGALGRRTRLFVAAAVGIGLVVLATAAEAMAEILVRHGRWTGGFIQALEQRRTLALVVGGGCAGLLVALHLLARRGRQPFARPALKWTLRATALLVVAGISATLDPVQHLTPWIRRAWWMPYLPGLIAAGAALTFGLRQSARRGRSAGALLLAGGIAFALSSWREQTVLPTDALEAQFATSWRQTLPENGRILHLSRAGEHISKLPVFPGSGLRIQSLVSGDEVRAQLLADGPAAYYHRSSLCSTAAGRAFCETIERSWKLEPLSIVDLPARPSLPYLPYVEDPVRVGLFRIHAPERALGSP